MRRLLTLSLSASLLLGSAVVGRLAAQDEKKAEAAPAPAPAQDKPADAPKDEAKPAEATPAPAPEPKPIPPEVEAKLEAARKAVAEAIVAAEKAGLVDTTIDPPPILDILITGRATDMAALKAITKDAPEAPLSPEVFGAWFTGYGKLEGIVAEKNVRIVPPSKGLKAWYDQRKLVFDRHLVEARKAAEAAAPAPATEEPKKEEAAPAPVDAPKEEAKPAEPAKEETAPAPTTEPAKEEAKPAEEPKTEEPKTEEPAPPAEQPKTEEPKTEESKAA